MSLVTGEPLKRNEREESLPNSIRSIALPKSQRRSSFASADNESTFLDLVKTQLSGLTSQC